MCRNVRSIEWHQKTYHEISWDYPFKCMDYWCTFFNNYFLASRPIIVNIHHFIFYIKTANIWRWLYCSVHCALQPCPGWPLFPSPWHWRPSPTGYCSSSYSTISPKYRYKKLSHKFYSSQADLYSKIQKNALLFTFKKLACYRLFTGQSPGQQ
jgi:hypothetical protein